LVDCGIDIAGAAIALIIMFDVRRLFRRNGTTREEAGGF
jgi:hypothetical protein